jgi:RND family efflux transporter MFP subunit
VGLNRFRPFFLGLGIVAIASGVTFAMIELKPKAKKEEFTKPPLVVRTADAALKEQLVFSTFQGEVRAKTDIELVTQVTGKVTSVSDKFIEGGEFKAGETLLQIDDTDYQVALKSAQASVASAQVDVDIEIATAATSVKEWQDLQESPISEANPLRLNKPQIDRAKAHFDAAKAELAAANLNYNRTKISAPFDGRIMTKSAELGQFMSRGSSVGRVFATDVMEVRIAMTDVQINELGLRLGYSSQKQGSAGLLAKVSTKLGGQQQVWLGHLKSVDASVNSTTRLFFATVVVPAPFQPESNKQGNAPLVPGLFVDVQVASTARLVGLEVPRTALRNGNQVYIYDNEQLRLKTIKPIYTSVEVVIVSDSNGQASHLAAGELVITSPVPGAYDGMPIKLHEESVVNTTVGSEESIEQESQPESNSDNDLEPDQFELEEVISPKKTAEPISQETDTQQN